MKDEIRHWALDEEHAQVAAWQRKAGQTKVEDKGINDASEGGSGIEKWECEECSEQQQAMTHRIDPACLDSGFFKCPREYREYSRAQNRPSERCFE